METLARRYCTATNRQGDPCLKRPIRGGTVCTNHGGLAPQTREAANRQLLAGRDLAIDALIRALESHGPTCEHCGCSSGDRDPAVIRAAQIVLDRTDFGPHVTIEAAPENADWARFMTDEEAEQMDRVIENARARQRAGVLPGEQAEPLQLDAGTIDADSFDVPEDDETPNADPVQEPAVLKPLGFSTSEDVNDG